MTTTDPGAHRSARRYKITFRLSALLALLPPVGLAAGLLYSLLAPRLYEASATMLVEQYRPAALDYASATTGERLTRTYARLVQARPVLAAAIDKLKIDAGVVELAKRVSARAVRDTQLIVLTVEDPSPQLATSIAEEIIAEFQRQNSMLQESRFVAARESLEQDLLAIKAAMQETEEELSALSGSAPATDLLRGRLENRLADYRASAGALLERIEGVRAAAIQPVATIVLVEPAQAGEQPSSPDTIGNVLIGGLAGLIVAGTILVLKYHFLPE